MSAMYDFYQMLDVYESAVLSVCGIGLLFVLLPRKLWSSHPRNN